MDRYRELARGRKHIRTAEEGLDLASHFGFHTYLPCVLGKGTLPTQNLVPDVIVIAILTGGGALWERSPEPLMISAGWNSVID